MFLDDTHSCAMLTPVGYLCQGCKREWESRHDSATVGDDIIAAVITLLVSVLAASILMVAALALPFVFLFVIAIVGRYVGRAIGRAVRWSTRGRRGRRLPALVSSFVILGTLLPTFVGLLPSWSVWVLAITILYLLAFWHEMHFQMA